MVKLPVRRIDGQLAVIIPEDLAAKLGLGEVQEVGAIDSDAGLTLTSNAEVQTQLALAQDVMARYRHALRELAK